MPTDDDSSIDSWTQQGVDALNDGRIDDAIEAFEAVVEAEPNDPAGWLDLGTAYAYGSRIEEALGAWSTSLSHMKGKNKAHSQDMRSIADNLLIIAKALDVQMDDIADKKNLRGVIAQLLLVMKN